MVEGESTVAQETRLAGPIKQIQKPKKCPKHHKEEKKML